MPTSSVGRTSASSRRGFTLLELLVVMMIAGLLAGLIGPRLTGSLGRTQIRTAAKKIAASLRYARSLAVSHNAIYAGRFDIEENRLIVGQLIQGKEAEESGETLLQPQTYTLPQGVRMEIPQADGMNPLFEIRFYPSGSAGGGRVILVDGDDRRQTLTVDFITGTVAVAGEG